MDSIKKMKIYLKRNKLILYYELYINLYIFFCFKNYVYTNNIIRKNDNIFINTSLCIFN